MSRGSGRRRGQRGHHVVDVDEVAGDVAVLVERDGPPVAGQLREQRDDPRVGVGERLTVAVDVLQPQHRQRDVVRASPCAEQVLLGELRGAVHAGRRGRARRARSSARVPRRGSPTDRPRAGRACGHRGWKSVPSVRRQVPSPYTARLLVSRKWAGTCPARVSPSSSWVVPTTLTVLWRVLSLSDWAVPVSAARWTTTSGRTLARTRSHVSGSTTSATTSSAASWRAAGRSRDAWTCGCRLSTTTQRSAPAARNRESAHPMNPAPPVTRTRPRGGTCPVMTPPRLTVRAVARRPVMVALR